MHRRLSISLFQFMIALCFFYAASVSCAGEGKPVAVMETDTYDFGEVFEGTDVIHDFIIKNTGDADLEIKEVKAG